MCTTTTEGLLPAEDSRHRRLPRAMGVTVSAIDSSGVVRVEGVGLDGLREPARCSIAAIPAQRCG